MIKIKKIIKGTEEENKGSLLWRIILGIVLVIFALISLSRFNATAALLYIIISIFIFIPGRIFKIYSKWMKVSIVIAAILMVGLFNHFFVNINAPVVEEYALGQEFLLPNDPNFALTITRAIREPTIMVKEQEYVTDESFLLVYLNTKFVGDISALPADNTAPLSMSFTLKDSDDNEYAVLDMDTKEMPQTQTLEKGESFYLYNIPKNATGLKLIFIAEDINKFVVVGLNN
ncbi:MAG: hypothetical protein Q8O03_03665 [Nanoarchaeota archaeon]|nr:hypothetical protein [Nanoarchaeota archaeon]